MKKLTLILTGIFFLLFINGCSVSSEIPMDELSENGKYHYKNKDLGFEIDLPETFKYYQVQRKDTDEYSDVEFFVPTSDMDYPQEVQGYAKPLTIRFYLNENWAQTEKKEYIEEVFLQMTPSMTGRFFLKFWKLEPNDWKGKWNEVVEEEIKSSLKVQ